MSGDKEAEENGLHPPRRYGLYNQGATCYLNSVLQILFMTTEIHDRLDPNIETDLQLKNIFEKLKQTTCGTKTITDTFGIKNVYEQRDAAECLEMILHKISKQASEAFKGELTIRIKCSEGHSINEETDPFFTLPVSLPDDVDTVYSVNTGFKSVFQSELFSGDNKVYCKECNTFKDANKECEMVTFPQILTLLLKRFDFDYTTMSHVKSDCCVDVPRTLQTEEKKYELYGTVNHIGSIRGGHYTATILPKGEQTWYNFNDDYVNEAKEQLHAKSSKPYNSKTAYLLMYRAAKCEMPVETKPQPSVPSATSSSQSSPPPTTALLPSDLPVYKQPCLPHLLQPYCQSHLASTLAASSPSSQPTAAVSEPSPMHAPHHVSNQSASSLTTGHKLSSKMSIYKGSPESLRPILVVGDSIIRFLRLHGAVTCCVSRGKTADFIELIPVLLDIHPSVHTVIVHSGTNDVMSRQSTRLYYELESLTTTVESLGRSKTLPSVLTLYVPALTMQPHQNQHPDLLQLHHHHHPHHPHQPTKITSTTITIIIPNTFTNPTNTRILTGYSSTSYTPTTTIIPTIFTSPITTCSSTIYSSITIIIPTIFTDSDCLLFPH
ncbi:ubiquitin carboxyl-terminal hydrolase 47-like isoform X2 [Scomber scombrus]|uniref:Ubiquitin carboxyl-terminal hydrolase n=1 Tax=Scomber scombrus TaxID=13677 RepID=A0AAV1N208_SCOSC